MNLQRPGRAVTASLAAAVALGVGVVAWTRHGDGPCTPILSESRAISEVVLANDRFAYDPQTDHNSGKYRAAIKDGNIARSKQKTLVTGNPQCFTAEAVRLQQE